MASASRRGVSPGARRVGQFGDRLRTHQRQKQKHTTDRVPSAAQLHQRAYAVAIAGVVRCDAHAGKVEIPHATDIPPSLLAGIIGRLPRAKGTAACLVNVRAASMASAHCGPTAAQRRLHRVAYLSVMASPLRSTFASKPTCLPVSSSTAPFWFVSTIPRAPVPTASPAPAAP
jgi:hypothetical protein